MFLDQEEVNTAADFRMQLYLPDASEMDRRDKYAGQKAALILRAFKPHLH